MKELLLSFIVPSKMKKYRFMSVLISILIFIVSIYFLSIPHQVYIKTHKDEYLSQKAYVNAYLQMPENLELGMDISGTTDFNKAQYKVNDKYEMVSSVPHSTFSIYEFNSIDVNLVTEQEPKTVNFHIVFDINDTLTAKLNSIKEDYEKIYTEDSTNKVSCASYIYYIDTLNKEFTSEEKTKRFEELHNTSDEELQKQMNEINNFDLFGIEEDGNDYLLIFMKTSLVTQIPFYDEVNEKMTYPALSTYYSVSEMQFDFTKTTNLKEFGIQIGDEMFNPLSSTDQTEYLIQVVGYVIVFPVIFVLLLSWSMKKRGVMKTFKEYYNVSSIASIIPLIITFILSWFIPKIVFVYGALFCMFTLFAFIRINTTPELGD